MIEYSLLKLLHIGALIFWLGLPLGAWMVLKWVESNTGATDPILAKVSKAFYFGILIEHIAFSILLLTGITLAYRFNLWGADWLNQKLMVILVVVLPLELLDVYLGNWVARKAAEKYFAGQTIRTWETKCLSFYHGLFTKIALVVIPLSVLIIMYIAVSKTAIS